MSVMNDMLESEFQLKQEIDSLHKQLAEARSAITQKNLAIREAMEWNWLDGDEEIPSEVVEMLHQALDAGRTK